MTKEITTAENPSEAYHFPEIQIRLRLIEGENLPSKESIDRPEIAVNLLKDVMKQLDREMVFMINMDSHLRPINFNVVSMGGLTSSEVPMQNIFKSALLSNASRMIILHNHPSGSPEPSQNDIAITKKIVEAGHLMNIPLVDHIIVGGMTGEMFSLHRKFPHIFEQSDSSIVSELLEKPGIDDKAVHIENSKIKVKIGKTCIGQPVEMEIDLTTNSINRQINGLTVTKDQCDSPETLLHLVKQIDLKAEQSITHQPPHVLLSLTEQAKTSPDITRVKLENGEVIKSSSKINEPATNMKRKI